MRLWHKDLIPFLPRQQLLGQWRECCLIAKSIAEKGTPNHLLVNRIMDYPPTHFIMYADIVFSEMAGRNYHADWSKCLEFFSEEELACYCFGKSISLDELFKDWHNDRYMHQCLLNLQEKFDCSGISEEEYRILVDNTVIEDL